MSETNDTLTSFKMVSNEMRDANLASSAAVEGFRIGEPPCSFVNNAESFLICCRIYKREAAAELRFL